MEKIITSLALILFAVRGAQAQAPTPSPMVQGEPETIYTDAQRERDMSQSRWLVTNMLHQSFSLDGQYARWQSPICPHVYGLTPVAAWLVEHRIREVATMVGAPVDHDDPCIPNIGIIFTAEPQASLMSIADKAPSLLQGGNQKLNVKYPVQAWYATFIQTNQGSKMLDIPWELVTPPLDGPPQIRTVDSRRLSTGFTAEMAAATVLVDSKAVTGKTLGELGDYLALMTLAQAGQYGECLETASIANLLLKCPAEDVVHSISHIDIALLTSLYEVPLSPEALQKQRLTGVIRRTLEKQAGKD